MSASFKVPDPLHWSDLKAMKVCPRWFQYQCTVGFVATDAMQFGTCLDAIFYKTTEKLAIYNKTKNRSGPQWEQFKIDNPDKEIVTQNAYDNAECAATALRASSAAMRVLDGASQLKLRWMIGDRECEGTPDSAGKRLTDLKATDPDPSKFYWHAQQMLWHAQVSWYKNALMQCGYDEPESVHIVAVRPKQPHIVSVIDVCESMLLDIGTREWMSALERLNVCEENDHWPAWTDEANYQWEAAE